MVANRESQTTSTPRSVSRRIDRKSTRLNSSHQIISYAVFCLKKKKHTSELQSPHQPVCRLRLQKQLAKTGSPSQASRRRGLHHQQPARLNRTHQLSPPLRRPV